MGAGFSLAMLAYLVELVGDVAPMWRLVMTPFLDAETRELVRDPVFAPWEA